MHKCVVSFLVSGKGSNFRKIAKKIQSGEIIAAPGILISDNEHAKALTIADDFGMKSFFVNPKSYTTREAHEREMVKLLKKYKTDLVAAAGYMRVLSPYFINEFRNKIINIHPALLPSFPGINAQKQAFDKGVKITGCTTHFIDEGTDTGPIIMQAAVRVLDNDTIESLSARILKEEHRIFPESVRLFCEKRLKIINNKVFIQ
jgi:phosphoribosylglycinamide formyltransferase-1